MEQTKANTAAAEAQAADDQANAAIADNQAKDATMRGLIEEDRRRAQLRAQLGSQRASFAANNIDASTGTAMEVLGDTAEAAAEDIGIIRGNAAREAWGYTVQGNNLRTTAANRKVTAKAQNRGTMLTGAAQMAGQGYSMFGGGRTANLTTG